MDLVSSTQQRNEATIVIFNVPQELFDHILFFVNLSQNSQPVMEQWSMLSLRTSLLKQCALVCRHWANQCRRYLFHGATLEVRSYRSIKSMIYYALHGSSFLISIHTLISGINVIQTHRSSSFLHLVFSFKSITGKQLFHLALQGPVPRNFPTCKLDTPHWSLPASIPAPPSLTAYNRILLTTIHLPSFGHVAKYISHFKLATQIDFRDLTWYNGGLRLHEPPTSIVRGPTQRRIPDEDFTLNISGCTNNGRIALQAMSTYKHSPLYLLSDDLGRERHAALMLINELFGENTRFLEVKTTCECHICV